MNTSDIPEFVYHYPIPTVDDVLIFAIVPVVFVIGLALSPRAFDKSEDGSRFRRKGTIVVSAMLVLPLFFIPTLIDIFHRIEQVSSVRAEQPVKFTKWAEENYGIKDADIDDMRNGQLVTIDGELMQVSLEYLRPSEGGIDKESYSSFVLVNQGKPIPVPKS